MIESFETSLKNLYENVAFDEALLEEAESNGKNYLRFWELPSYCVVLGASRPLTDDVYIDVCKAQQISVLRRCSGGGTVLLGPGCLNYSLVLQTKRAPELQSITTTTCYLLNQIKSALSPLLHEIAIKGTSDLTFNGLKFSGNAQRRKLNTILFHGTLLYAFNLDKVSHYLKHPPIEPEYRQKRLHGQFISNVPLSKTTLISALEKQFQAQKFGIPELSNMASLIKDKYHSLV